MGLSLNRAVGRVDGPSSWPPADEAGVAFILDHRRAVSALEEAPKTLTELEIAHAIQPLSLRRLWCAPQNSTDTQGYNHSPAESERQCR